MRLPKWTTKFPDRLRLPLACGLLAVLFAMLFAFGANRAVERCGARVRSDVAAMETRDVGLLLGTRYGRNPYFRYRIEAAAELYHAGKVRKLLVSGDNSRKEYDEPTAMRTALEARGVKPEDIIEDYAGFRTLDSIVRARKVFGVTKLTVISQGFHCKRAIYIADHCGVDAIGFAAEDVRWRSYRIRNALRENLSRTLAAVDVCLGRSPRFLGEPIPVL